MADSDVCLLCGCLFGELHEARKGWCRECKEGPFCRSCLIMRHKPNHGHLWWRKLLKWVGIRRCQCLLCHEVGRR